MLWILSSLDSAVGAGQADLCSNDSLQHIVEPEALQGLAA